MNKKLEIGRREFFKSAAFGIAGAAVPVRAARGEAKVQAAQSTEKNPPKIKEYRVLGRTGFQVSDLATGYIQDFGVFSAMLDAGVNYIDTGVCSPARSGWMSSRPKGFTPPCRSSRPKAASGSSACPTTGHSGSATPKKAWTRCCCGRSKTVGLMSSSWPTTSFSWAEARG